MRGTGRGSGPGSWPATPTRRGLLAAGLSLAALGTRRSQAASASVIAPERARGRALLAAARRWGCQYQEIDTQKIAASDLDLVVVEPMLDDWSMRAIDAGELAAMRVKPDGSRRLVLAYLPLGETDTNRWYWPRRWRRNPPDWVGPENPNWPGSRHVRYWHPRWRSLVLDGPDSLLGRILAVGYDGALLDRVDAYLDWREERPQGMDDMVALVAATAARARAHDPGFLLLPQNAENLLLRDDWLALIDAHNKESLLFGLAGQGIPNDVSDVAWSLTRLKHAGAAGIRMLATEYLDDPVQSASARERLAALGFLPFIGRRELDVFPGDDHPRDPGRSL